MLNVLTPVSTGGGLGGVGFPSRCAQCSAPLCKTAQYLKIPTFTTTFTPRRERSLGFLQSVEASSPPALRDMGCADEQLPAASGKVPEDAIRIKFLCSHGGKILPKPDGQLRYVGGDTRLVSFSKSITFADLSSKLEKLFGPNLCLKYQLPSEDLDTLISVTCDDDVENLVEEYDKNEARDGASRLRAFLFPRTGASVTDSNPCTCHTIDDAKGLTVSSSHPQVADCTCPASAMFQMPGYLFGLENACIVHGCRQQHQDGDNQLSPRPLVDDKSFFMKSMRPTSPLATQREYSRQQFIDTGGRGPALTTSALGPLVSNHHQHMWDRKKFWDEGVLVNQRGDEKRHMDLNMEAHHHNYQQDVVNGISMVRVSSKDRLVPGFMEVSGVDTLSVFDRQPRPQSIPRADVHPDVVEDSRQDGHYQGNTRHYKPPDVQRAPATASEMQWGSPQPVTSAFHTGGERSVESRRNSGDSDEGSHRKLEGHSGADGVAHSLPVIITAEVPHGLKMQEAYRHEEPMVKQVRHGEFEQVQYDHFHHLGKGHFQPVHWQLHEPQELQQHQISTLEPVRTGHNTHGMQRHGQSLEYQIPAAAHHHHMICPPNSIRTMPRSDASSITRLHRQVAPASTPRVDPPSPRRGQVPSVGSHFTSRHGVWVLQKHDMNYLPSNKAQHPSGLPGSQAFMTALEQPCLYDQNGGQAHLTDKGSLANLDPPISQAQYFDKMILSTQDGTIGQVHCDDDLQYGCMSNNHEAQGIPS